MSISLQGVVGRGDFERSLNFSVADGEVLAITGPNGSGKSTVVHSIAGLIPLRSGVLQSNGTTWDEPDKNIWVESENRTCGVVFQDLRLFPHMNVISNVAFGLRARGIHKDEAMARSRDVMARVGLKSFEKRRPSDISGGERQRVALARALVIEPHVLLLDEPLAAIDGASRMTLRDLLSSVSGSFHGVVLLVSHEAQDVESMATSYLELKIPD